MPPESMTLTYTPTQADFDRFAVLSGDDNPIHVDPAFAGRTRFGRTVSHGMLLYSLLHRAISAAFPGATHLEQHLMFPNPAYADEELALEIKVLERLPSQVLLATRIVRTSGEAVCEGQARLTWEIA